MSRGFKSSQRDRCTLHKKHLTDFKVFILGRPEWHVLPLTGHTYEVLHVMKNDRSGDGDHSFVYRNDHNDHLTVQADLVPFMERFMKQRKRKPA